MLVGSYNSSLVVASIFVAVLASYTALDMAGRVTRATGKAAHWWLAGGAAAMGLGIWSMHFVGMLAFSLPIPIGYDTAITALSLLIAIALSAFALWTVCQPTLPWKRLIAGAVVMGAGVASMHYTGMAAMRMKPGITYDPLLWAASLLIAIAASAAAQWIAFRLRSDGGHTRLLRAGAAVVMGAAIAGMHYTGMFAAEFPVGSVCSAARDGVSSMWLAPVIIVVTIAVLSIALITSVLDLRLESRTAVLAVSLAQANEELTYLALHDNLTKLPNRLLLEDRLNQAISAADREHACFALMFLDLDGFKAVNDAYGHHIGDLLLVDIAQRIQKSIRRNDTVARLGGDEFALIVRVAEAADAGALATDLLRSIDLPVHAGGYELRVSGSIGISMYPGDGHDPHELLSTADAAMYSAKASGRATFCYFEASMQRNVQVQLQLLQELRTAVSRNELVLEYQPKLQAPHGPVVGAEALLRWHHPTRGLLQPGDFIPVAEKTGLILSIGDWVLDEACRQMRAWVDLGNTDWTMSVNLSPLQFAHTALVQTVADTLALHRLDPHHLMLEITESTAMRDVEASLATLEKLKAMGVRISIDDFGTGYSSLLYLKRLPATELKIDRGFVRDVAGDSEDAAIVSAIVALGRTLRLSVVAEGVETKEQQESLTELGCNSLQGYLLGRPMNAEHFLEAANALTSGHA
ncbi:putative bifunctional diguanylate cyclase/phosphodiesterase [Paraburkholderia sp.]|jgi:diguanylate cyclase (GGDEF)-like protein|uniref:putative bifunctional diguanylate cyclase/phosphodiesterase n=1 Tax=Paraburkholderia sp. TaxID=1926495 RepID=UPI002F41EDDD